MSKNIQAITFDVGGTLIDPWPSVGHVYAEVAAQHGVRNAEPEVLNRRFAQAWRAKSNFDYSRAAWAELVAQTFHGPSGAEMELSFFDDLYHRFAGPEVWRIYDDVQSTLKPLRERGVKLGIISNWDERLRPLLRGLKLDQFFEVVVVSSELGQHKPSPAIFAHALQRLRLPGEVVLHVGDSVTEDLVGAKKAGLSALRLNRRSHAPGRTEIGSLAELLDGVK